MKNLIERISNIRNAQRLGRKQVSFSFPFDATTSSLKRNLLRILVREGYLESFSVVQSASVGTASPNTVFTVFLKYGARGEPAIRDMRLISLSGRRVYLPISALWQPQFLDGTLVLSTSRGLLTDREARYFGVGGEAIRGIRLQFFHAFTLCPFFYYSCLRTRVSAKIRSSWFISESYRSLPPSPARDFFWSSSFSSH
jgi:small subunit ribosomal protein S8